jgi:dihydrofolate synthase/folylpolyglutamate synthase
MLRDAEEYLYSLRNQGAKLGLERMEALLLALESPQKNYPSILVAGTSGKGSTAAMLSSILSSAGYKSGRFTSPHLSRLTERITIDGVEIPDDEFVSILDSIRESISGMKNDPGFSHPTFFEIITALAMLYFSREKVDIAVFEVGLGGKLDSTNTMDHIISIITNVSLEHTRILGDTVGKIAGEKAGIIRSNVPTITAADDPAAICVIQDVCRKKASPLFVLGSDFSVNGTADDFDFSAGDCQISNLRLSLNGDFQLKNAVCAISAITCLADAGFDIPDDAIRNGLLNLRWPGRLEIMQRNPLVIIDGAKDQKSAEIVAPEIQKMTEGKRKVLVLAISSDKNIQSMASSLVPGFDVVIASEHRIDDRSARAEDIASYAKEHCDSCIILPGLEDAMKMAIGLAGSDGAVVLAGSVFAAGQAREIWVGSGAAGFGSGLNEPSKGL